MLKSPAAVGQARVLFTLDSRVGAETAAVCGEWDGWSPNPMRRDPEGGFNLSVDLELGRSYRFRYLLDGGRWENDWAADSYVPNGFGEEDSVVDLTTVNQAPPSQTVPEVTTGKASNGGRQATRKDASAAADSSRARRNKGLLVVESGLRRGKKKTSSKHGSTSKSSKNK